MTDNDNIWHTVPVCIETRTHESFNCTIHQGSSLSGILNEWAIERGLILGNYDFYYNREQIEGIESPATLGMNSVDNIIEALHKDELRIIVRDEERSKITGYIQRKNMMFHRLMNHYASIIDVEKSNLVFTINGIQIFGHEHPWEFNFKHFDVVEVMPVELYMSKNMHSLQL